MNIKEKIIKKFISLFLLVFVGSGVVFASISWPAAPSWETSGWLIGSIYGAFTIDSWNVGIGKNPTSKLDVNGTVTASNFAWTLTTPAQTNITSVWTLSSLAVSGSVTIDTSTLFIDSTNNRVWIGTITPWIDLDVADSDLAHIRAVITWQTNNPSIYLLADEANNKWWLYSTAPKLEIGANNSIHMTVDSSWNVWIWKSPSVRLDVDWNISATNIAGIILTPSQTNITSVWTLSSLNVTWDIIADTETFKVDSTNNRVSIWTTSPNETLTVSGAISLSEVSSVSLPPNWFWTIYARAGWVIDSYTSLLLHGDGTTTTISDSSWNDHSVTSVNGATQTDPPTSKFWKAIYFDATDDYVSIPNSSDWTFWTDPFTFDWWIYLDAMPASYFHIFSTAGADSKWYKPQIDSTGAVECMIGLNGSGWLRPKSSAWTISAGQWYHIACVRNGTTYKVYVDGVEKASAEYSTNQWDGGADGLKIARWELQTNYHINWYIDEFRVSKWIARWTANFTPPPVPYWGWLYYKQSDGSITNIVGWWWWAWWSLWTQSTNDLYYTTWKVWIGTETPDVTLDISWTDAINIPSWTTAQRPTWVNGMMRYNSTENNFEVYASWSWQKMNIGNEYAFHASKTSGSQPIPQDVPTKVDFWNLEFDTTNWDFDLTNDRFIPSVAWKYQMNICIRLDDIQNMIWHLFIKKNSDTWFKGLLRVDNSWFRQSVCWSTILEANGTTDYFEIMVMSNATNSVMDGGSGWNHWSAFLIWWAFWVAWSSNLWNQNSSDISYTSWNVWVWTASPSVKLDVDWKIKSSGNVVVSGIQLVECSSFSWNSTDTCNSVWAYNARCPDWKKVIWWGCHCNANYVTYDIPAMSQQNWSCGCSSWVVPTSVRAICAVIE